MTYILYGMAGSLYTGKARAYLKRRHIPFTEHPAGGPRYIQHVLPQIGRWIIPVLETPDGALIQDSADIIAFLERAHPPQIPVAPPSRLLNVITRLFEMYGGEGMLRPAMHYRWNFDAENLGFLQSDFVSGLAPGATAEEAAARFAMASMMMRQATTSVGVAPESIPAIEQSYGEFLDLFEAHLTRAPFLLGGAPTLGDYGLIGPLYAHLSRDPVPSMLMKRRAPRVWRWVERMNAPEFGTREFGDIPDDLFDAEALPESLLALLRFVAEDYLCEIRAFVQGANEWLADKSPTAPEFARPCYRALTTTSFSWRGVTIAMPVMPYRILMLQNIQDEADGATGPERAAIVALLQAAGLAELLDLRVAWRTERRENREVWAGLNSV